MSGLAWCHSVRVFFLRRRRFRTTTSIFPLRASFSPYLLPERCSCRFEHFGRDFRLSEREWARWLYTYITVSFLTFVLHLVYRSPRPLRSHTEKQWLLLCTYLYPFSQHLSSSTAFDTFSYITASVSNMRVLFNLAAIAVAAVGSLAQSMPNSFDIPPGGYLLKAGQPTTFKWSNLAGSTVTLTLRDGSNGALNPGTLIQGMLSSYVVVRSFSSISSLSLPPILYEPQRLYPLSLPLRTLFSQRPQHRHLHLHTPLQHRRRQLLHHPNHRRPGHLQGQLHPSIRHPLPRQSRPHRLLRFRRFDRYYRHRHRHREHRYSSDHGHHRSEHRHHNCDR